MLEWYMHVYMLVTELSTTNKHQYVISKLNHVQEWSEQANVGRRGAEIFQHFTLSINVHSAK